MNWLDWHFLTGTPILARLMAGLLKPKNKVLGIDLAGKVDFRACGQSVDKFEKSLDGSTETHIMAECKRRPKLGLFDPTSITFEECPGGHFGKSNILIPAS